MSSGPQSLIGKPVTDPSSRRFISRFVNEAPKVDHFAELEIVEYFANGIAVYFDKHQRIVTMFFHDGITEEGYDRYKGPLPCGLSFLDNKIAVMHKLGNCAARGETRMGAAAPWERFDFDS